MTSHEGTRVTLHSLKVSTRTKKVLVRHTTPLEARMKDVHDEVLSQSRPLT
jgi:hypothetical protein